jgi:hypothetical protein
VFPDQPVAGQPAELGLFQQDFSLSVPLFQSPADKWSRAMCVRNQNFATGALLPDTGEAFPDELWNVRREPAWARDLSPSRRQSRGGLGGRKIGDDDRSAQIG